MTAAPIALSAMGAAVMWRRMGDLNPRGFYPNTISNRAH